MSTDPPRIPRQSEKRESKVSSSDMNSVAMFFGLVLLAIGVVMAFFRGILGIITPVAVLAAGIMLLVLAVVLTLKSERKAEEARREEVRAQLSPDSSTSKYFNRLVDINLENLSAYYITVKSHANKSFLTSLFVGLAGFILIGVGVALSFDTKTSNLTTAILSGGSGVLTEFISAVFFYLYNQTVRQMKGYHDSLLNVQNILLSFKLVDESQEANKARMIEIMINYLVGAKIHESPAPESAASASGRSKPWHSAEEAPREPNGHARPPGDLVL